MTAFAAEYRDDGSSLGSAVQLRSHLSALQLSDSAFPSGRFTLSYGLETLAHSDLLATPDRTSRLLAFLNDAIRFGIGPSDGVAVACVHRAYRDGQIDLELVMRADQRLTAVKLACESREASTRTGRALLHTATAGLGAAPLSDFAEQVDAGRCPGNHAVVLGLVSAALGVPRLQAIAGELYAFASAWVAAAVRLSLIDHVEAQVLVHLTHPVTVAASIKAVDGDVVNISASTPLLDVMAMRHEESKLRLFAS